MYLLVLVLVLQPINYLLAGDPKCNVTVDVTNGVRDGVNIINEGVIYTPADYFLDGDTTYGCVCHVKQCLRNCCSPGEILNVTTKTCTKSSSGVLQNQFSVHSIINVPDNKVCEEKKIKIRIGVNFQIVEGMLVWSDMTFSFKDYCVTVVDDQLYAIGCVSPESSLDAILPALGMIISMPFLAITFLVYLIIPDKNLHRKALMFYVLSLLLSYVFLVTVQLHNDEFEEVPCHLLGYLIMFFFLASFFWMNVMCIDMWLAFSGWKGFASKRSSECKRFIYYSIYAWGLPGLHVFVVWLLNTHWMSDSEYHPQLGVRKCFLEDGLPVFFYFYFPMAILIGINIVLFAVTILKIRRVKKDTRMLKHTDSKRHSYEDDKQQQFRLYLKLMFAMGVNWIMEIVSWACLWRMKTIPTWVWYLTDLTNALYGVFIFFIFVAKKNIWKSLKKRYYVCIGKPYTAHSIVTSQTTRTSNVSSTDPGEHRMISLRN